MKRLLSSLMFYCVFSYSFGDSPSKQNTKYDNNYYLRLVKKQSQKSSNPNDGMIPGMGYSSDTQARGFTACYKPLTITTSGQSSSVNFDTSHDISKIINIFNVKGSFEAGYGLFSANAMFKYFRHLEEDNYSLSLNYYQKITQSKNMTYSYNPDDILTDTGKAIYRSGENSLFRLICGDRLVDSYEEGAALIMSMKVELASRYQKEIFAREMGASFGSFFEASIKIKNIAERHHLFGKIKIDGFQLGGDPTQLSTMLSRRVIECDIRNVAACQATAQAMLDYASKDFPAQFRREGGIWISPLTNTGGLKLGWFVSDLGLKLSPTYITPEVIASRTFLLDAQKRNLDAAARYRNILTMYPGGDVASSHFAPGHREQINALNNNVAANLSLLNVGMGGGSGSALDCLKFPARCVAIKNEIASNLKSIEDNTKKLASCRNPNIFLNPRAICNHQNPSRNHHFNRVEFPNETECRAFGRMEVEFRMFRPIWIPLDCQGYVPYAPAIW